MVSVVLGRGAACRPSAVRPGHRVPSPGCYNCQDVAVSPWCALLIVALVALDLPGCGRSSTPRNVLVVTLDTLRADRVGSYGYKDARTPGARRAGRPRRPLRGGDHDDAADAAGAHRPLHGHVADCARRARQHGFYVADSVPRWPRCSRARGYRTGGFVGAFVLDSRWGIAQGFDSISTSSTCPRTSVPAWTRSSGLATRWSIERSRGWRQRRRRGPSSPGCTSTTRTRLTGAASRSARRGFPPTRDGAYDAEVAYTDPQVGRLLTALRRGRDARRHARGGRRPTTASSSGEHREQSHGFFVYDASVQIPSSWPGPASTPRVVTDQVRIVDVMPTLLDLAGIEIPAAVQGTTLRPRARRPAGQELLAFAETWYPRYHYGWSELTAVRDGRFKFILAPRRELYDLAKDPGELTQPRRGRPRSRRRVRARPARARRADHASADGQRRAAGRRPDVEQRLRALGYVGRRRAPATSKTGRAEIPRIPSSSTTCCCWPERIRRPAATTRPPPRCSRRWPPTRTSSKAHSRLGNIYTKAGTARRRRGRVPAGARAGSPSTSSQPTTWPWHTARWARSTRPWSVSNARSNSIRAAAARTFSSATSTCSRGSRPRRWTC